MTESWKINADVQEELRAMRAELNRTRRQLAEAQAQTRVDVLCVSMRSAASPFGVYDAELRYQAVNARTLTLWRRTEDELIGYTDEELFPDEQTREYVPALRRAFERGRPQTTLVNIAEGTPGVLTLVSTYIPVVEPESGVVQEVIWLCHDITGLKLAAEERLRLESQIQEAHKLESLGVLAGGVAHDFNNLLTVILGNASVLGLRLRPDSPLRENLQKIEATALRAAELAKQMLTYSGLAKRKTEELGINRTVREMRDLLEAVTGSGVELVLELGAQLSKVRVDPGQLRQVVMNLVINASDAIGEERGEITIRTGAVERPIEGLGAVNYCSQLGDGQGPYVFLQVEDTGSGMDEATLARMFEPFFTTREGAKGLGLGVVMGIARTHGGELVVESIPGEGTTLRILLPQLLPTDDEESEETTKSWLTWKGQGALLVIEDDASSADLARDVLERFGYKVSVAHTPEEGLRLLSTREFKAVLVDAELASRRRPTLFKDLAAASPGVRLVLCSTEPEAAMQFFRDFPFEGVVRKPFRARTLIQQLSQLK